jgi:hypothetical protein
MFSFILDTHYHLDYRSIFDSLEKNKIDGYAIQGMKECLCEPRCDHDLTVREKHPHMNLAKQLAAHKTAIVKKWYRRILASYPEQTARFLDNQKDPFLNPVGQHSQQSLQCLFDLLGDESNPAAMQKALDPIIRIRAIQDFTPSKALGFIFDLKILIREELPELIEHTDKQLLLDHRIDEMALAAFDLYMQCREKIYELKAGEIRERTYKAFARAGLVKDPI